MSDLVERSRAMSDSLAVAAHRLGLHPGDNTLEDAGMLLREAAAAIQFGAAEITRLRARLAVKDKALEPLTRLPDFVDRNKWTDDAVVHFKNGASVLNTVSLGDLRRAREAWGGEK